MNMENWIGAGTFLTAIFTVYLALRKGKRDGSKEDAADAAETKRHYRILEDYVNDLRAAMTAAGIKVPPWPKELTEK